MIRGLKRFLFLVLVFQGNLLFSQQKDACLWMSVNLEKKISQKFTVEFTEEVRLNENITEAGTIFSQLGVEYRPFSRLKVAASYRFSQRRQLNDTYEGRNSFMLDLTYRERIKPVTFFLRARFQSVFNDIYSLKEGETPKDYLRTRLTVKADAAKRLKPYVSAEVFFNLNDPVTASFDEARYCAGAEYSFSRIHMIDLYYMIRKDYNVPYPETDFIIGIGYYLTIPDLKKR